MFKTLLSPMSELQQMIDSMDRAFNTVRSEPRPTFQNSEMILPVDIWQKDNTVFIRAAVPGVAKEDLDIQVAEHILTISGETKHEALQDDKANFWRREYALGRFRRSIRLPDFAISEKIEASFKNGFVTISVPLAIQSPKVVQVPIRSSIEGTTGALEQQTETSKEESVSSSKSKP
jgi:HSP20 family protein